jgi:cell division protein FtsX
MRAFVTAIAVMLVLSVGAGAVLTVMDQSTTQKYSTDKGDVRLTD